MNATDTISNIKGYVPTIEIAKKEISDGTTLVILAKGNRYSVCKSRPCPSWLGGGSARIVAPAMVEYDNEATARDFFDAIK